MPAPHRKLLARARRRLRPIRRAWLLKEARDLLVRSGVFDTEWYEAQTGLSFASVHDAITHYLREPRRLARSPHPLFEPEWVDAASWNKRAADPLVWYLSSRAARTSRSPHPLVDLEWLRPKVETPTTREWGPWVEWVRGLQPDSLLPPFEGSRTDLTWGELRGRLLDAMNMWRMQTETMKTPRLVEHYRATPIPAQHDIPPPDRLGEPRVSVIMPTWNRGSRLRQAVQSVQAQTLEDWELIVVDDGSTDDTLAVLEGLSRFDSRIRVVAGERGGVCKARNQGLELARGTFVAFLDSDNTWRPEFLRSMVDTLEANGWDMGHGVLKVNGRDRTAYRAFEGSREHLLAGNYIDLNVLVVRRALLEEVGGFDATLRRAVDYDLVLCLSEHTTPHLIDVIGAEYSEDVTDESRISVAEPTTWNLVVLAKHLVDWDKAQRHARQPGRISVVLPVRRDLGRTVASARTLATESHLLDLEVVIVAVGASRSHFAIATAMAAILPRGKAIRTPVDLGQSVATNLGAVETTGETLILARNSIAMESGWVAPLAAGLDRKGVALAQSLSLRSDGTVASAGAVFPPRQTYPWPLLESFPASDAKRLGSVPIPAAYSGNLAIRAEDLMAVKGLDALFGNSFAETDLSLRLSSRGLGSTVLVPESVGTGNAQARFGFPHNHWESGRILTERWPIPPDCSEGLWEKAGLQVVHYRQVEIAPNRDQSAGRPPLVTRRPDVARPTRLAINEHPPRLRWTIDTAAPAGPRGELWGDTHFARSLAAALERRGQDVAVDSRDARTRRTREIDDVLLVLRGLDDVAPPPGVISLQWIISHPDEVSPREASRFDAVFAASSMWAATHTKEWGFNIKPLLQCTDPALFSPHRGEPDSGAPVLYVGNSRKVLRPSLRAAIASGADVWVYGSGWSGLIEDRFVRAPSVPNEEVAELYAASSIVLNDHWDDMRRSGFLSNRLFDAVACAARVISDDAAGIQDVFGDAVAVFHSQADMNRLLQSRFGEHFRTYEERLALSDVVRSEHSFDRRAEQLLDAALEIRAHLSAPREAARVVPSTSRLRRW